MKRIWLHIVPAIVLTALLTSCGSDSSQSSQGSSYKETKTMVLDILKSEDGKKAMKAAQASSGGGGESQIKLLSTGESQQLQMAVKDVLTAEENNKFLQDMMKDPKFAGDFAKAIQKDMKQLNKDLLKDPEYQKQMIQVMKNPDYENMLLDTMKTAQYRQQVMTVIEESMQSPLFRSELVKLLKSAMEEETKSKSDKKSKEGGGGGSQDSSKKSDSGSGGGS